MSVRDGACTPEWLANALGYFDLDPCSNERSHIRAAVALMETLGDDGLIGLTAYDWRVFINPPYSRGQVIKWVRHYKHTDFTFLLRWDPSTRWFKELIAECEVVWFADERIEFEPPPGITFSRNPYPHALFFKRWPDDDTRNALNDLGRFYVVGRFSPNSNLIRTDWRPRYGV